MEEEYSLSLIVTCRILEFYLGATHFIGISVATLINRFFIINGHIYYLGTVYTANIRHT